MANNIIDSKSTWMYGEVGVRLSALRDSEVYKGAAREIINMTITDIGNLKVANKIVSEDLGIDEVLKTAATKGAHTAFLTPTKVGLIHTKDGTVDGTPTVHGKTFTEKANISAIKDMLYINEVGVGHLVYQISGNTLTAVTDFWSNVIFPLDHKKPIEWDIYKYQEYVDDQDSTHKITTLSFIYTDESIYLSSNHTGQILYATSKLPISRLFFSYQANIKKKDITIDTDVAGSTVTKGDMLAVMRNYEEVKNGRQYYVGNTPITFSGKGHDTNYSTHDNFYYKMNNDIDYGELVFGELNNFVDDIIDVGVLQSRMYVITNKKIYFSETSNYSNFRNGTETADPFFIEPAAINGITPNMIRGIASKALYVVTDRGVYSIGYNKYLTALTIMVDVASDTPATGEVVLMDGNMFYISDTGDLTAMQVVEATDLKETYDTFRVEKYSINRQFERLGMMYIDGKRMLVATNSKDKDHLYLYESLGVNKFRRVRLESPIEIKNKPILNVGTSVTTQSKLLKSGKTVYETATLYNLPPSLQTNNGGKFLNDVGSRVHRVILKMYNERNGDKTGIKHIGFFPGNEIGKADKELKTNPLGAISEDLFSIYTVKTSFSPLSGYQVAITTNGGEEGVEVQAIESIISVASL